MRDRTESGSGSQFIYLTKLVWYDIMNELFVKKTKRERTGSQIVYLTNTKRYDIINELSQTRKKKKKKGVKRFPRE